MKTGVSVRCCDVNKCDQLMEVGKNAPIEVCKEGCGSFGGGESSGSSWVDLVLVNIWWRLDKGNPTSS